MNTEPPNPPPTGPTGANSPPTAATFDPARLKAAMKAFKKRLKLSRLDDESRVGHGPMSSGGRSDIVAITPPDQYPREVWEELTRIGKLRRAGQGMYELGDAP